MTINKYESLKVTLVLNHGRRRWELIFQEKGLVPDYRYLLWLASSQTGDLHVNLGCCRNEEENFQILLPYSNDIEMKSQEKQGQEMIKYLKEISSFSMSQNGSGGTAVAVVKLNAEYQICFSQDFAAKDCWKKLQRSRSVSTLMAWHAIPHRRFGDRHSYITVEENLITASDLELIVRQFLLGEEIEIPWDCPEDWDYSEEDWDYSEEDQTEGRWRRVFNFIISNFGAWLSRLIEGD